MQTNPQFYRDPEGILAHAIRLRSYYFSPGVWYDQ
jgi:hypothetical protein